MITMIVIIESVVQKMFLHVIFKKIIFTSPSVYSFHNSTRTRTVSNPWFYTSREGVPSLRLIEK